MNVSVPPGFAAFRAAYEDGRGSLVWRKGVSDLDTPVAAFLKLAHGQPNSFLLESVEGGAKRGRYSIIGMAPDLIWKCENGKASVNRQALSAPHAFLPDPRPPLDSLRALIAEVRLDVPANLPPMSGGLVGYLGYDMVRLMENLPDKNKDTLGVPEGVMVRPTLFAIFDNVNDELSLVSPVYPQPEISAAEAWSRAQARLAEAADALDRPMPHQPPAATDQGPKVAFARSGLTVSWASRYQNLLELAEACDVPAKWSCRTGVCHTCETGLISGSVSYQPEPIEPAADGNVLLCCSRPAEDVALDM